MRDAVSDKAFSCWAEDYSRSRPPRGRGRAGVVFGKAGGRLGGGAEANKRHGAGDAGAAVEEVKGSLGRPAGVIREQLGVARAEVVRADDAGVVRPGDGAVVDGFLVHGRLGVEAEQHDGGAVDRRQLALDGVEHRRGSAAAASSIPGFTSGKPAMQTAPMATASHVFGPRASRPLIAAAPATTQHATHGASGRG